MSKGMRRHWPIIFAGVIFAATLFFLLGASLRLTEGHIVYALDDAYIHMAMAKNFAGHGVWGISRYHFSSSSSSPLWTLLLASIYWVFGVNDTAPFILNGIFSLLVLFVVYLTLDRSHFGGGYTALILLGIIFLTPLPTLTLVGMEHILHALGSIIFVYLLAVFISKKEFGFFESVVLLVLAPLVTLIRYESLFFIFVSCIICILRKRVKYSFVLGLAATTPVILYGLLSVSRGWSFLPTPIFLKSGLLFLGANGGITSFIAYSMYWFVVRIFGCPAILFLASTAIYILGFERHTWTWNKSQVMLVVFTLTSLLHMLFAEVGQLFRYEAYLVVLGIFVLSHILHRYVPKEIPISLLVVLIIIIAYFRVVPSLVYSPHATENIYKQQYQMGLFLRDFYEGRSVAVNDIGVVNYLADIRNLDLVGIGSVDVAEARMNGRYISELGTFAKKNNVSIAILYERWFDAYGVPLEWVNVGEWGIVDNVVEGSDTVSFYAVNPSERDGLIRNLKVFSEKLPADVVQSGVYTRE